MTAIRSNQDFGSVARIINLPNGTDPQHPATVSQLNSAIEGLAWKDEVRVATDANINLASPGANVDGIAMSAGDRVLVRAQTDTTENGIYLWNGAAVAMTRSLDASTEAEITRATVSVRLGTYEDITFHMTEIVETFGSDGIDWVVFGSAASPASETTAGIAELATQAETDTGTDDARIVTPLKLATWSGRTRKATGTIGDGAATQYDATHNFNTRNVKVEVYRNASPWDSIVCDISRPDANTVRFNFAAAPTSNQFAYVILA